MNRKQTILVAAIALLGSTAAFAQSEIESQHFGTNQKSTVSRAAVRAEVMAALAAGELPISDEVLTAAVPSRSSSRDAVRAEARAKARVNTPQDARIGVGY